MHVSSKHNIKRGNITCVDNIFLVVNDKKGALFLLASALLNFAYMLLIIIVFYEVPKRWYG